ncbi:MAG: DUF4143 domain-containing protein [Bacteroidales bacterium]|nr:DUF4143 domain-containing protein [Bacteroidales bacterium]
MIKREISQKILDLSEKFPVITVTGPRQSGKTTLLRNLFGDLFLLQPHHRNFSKRLVKRPKLYFYDTGLCCSLLRIELES